MRISRPPALEPRPRLFSCSDFFVLKNIIFGPVVLCFATCCSLQFQCDRAATKGGRRQNDSLSLVLILLEKRALLYQRAARAKAQKPRLGRTCPNRTNTTTGFPSTRRSHSSLTTTFFSDHRTHSFTTTAPASPLTTIRAFIQSFAASWTLLLFYGTCTYTSQSAFPARIRRTNTKPHQLLSHLPSNDTASRSHSRQLFRPLPCLT